MAAVLFGVAVEQRGPAPLIPLPLADGSLSVDRENRTLDTISFRFIKIHPSLDIFFSSRSAVNPLGYIRVLFRTKQEEINGPI